MRAMCTGGITLYKPPNGHEFVAKKLFRPYHPQGRRLFRVWQYIDGNPAKWLEDPYYVNKNNGGRSL